MSAVGSAPDSTRCASVALVLGSGGARGFAHIGVTQALLEAGVEIVAVAGSSMGALVGGMHAAGKLDDFADWATGLGRVEMLRLVDVALSGPGAIRGDRLFRVVGELLDGVTIEELPIPYTAVAVDLVSRREVWFQRGPLDVAIRASTAIPSFFVPIELNGRLLVDGAVLDPVPVAPVAAAHADAVVAVSLDGQGSASSAPVSESTDERSAADWSDRLRGTAARWFDSEMMGVVRRRLTPDLEASLRTRLDGELRHHDTIDDQALGTVDVVQASYEVMQSALTRHRLAAFTPDHLVSVPKNSCRTLDFHRAAEMIELGRRLAEPLVAELAPHPTTIESATAAVP